MLANTTTKVVIIDIQLLYDHLLPTSPSSQIYLHP